MDLGNLVVHPHCQQLQLWLTWKAGFRHILQMMWKKAQSPPPQRCKDCLLNINKLSVVHRYSLLIAQCITSDTASIFCSWKRNWDMSTFHSVSYKQPTTLSITLGITGLKVWLEVFHCMQQIILLFIRLQLPLLLLQFFCGMLQPCFYNLPNFCLVRFQPLVFLYGSWNKFGDLF